MVVLDGNFPVGRGTGTDYPYTNIFQCMLERKDAITNEVLEPTKFVLAYTTLFSIKHYHLTVLPLLPMTHIYSPQIQSQVSHGKHSLHLYPLSGAVMRLQLLACT